MQGQAVHGRTLKQVVSLQPQHMEELMNSAVGVEPVRIADVEGLEYAMQAEQDHIHAVESSEAFNTDATFERSLLQVSFPFWLRFEAL